jgi:hypothetical protein
MSMPFEEMDYRVREQILERSKKRILRSKAARRKAIDHSVVLILEQKIKNREYKRQGKWNSGKNEHERL